MDSTMTLTTGPAASGISSRAAGWPRSGRLPSCCPSGCTVASVTHPPVPEKWRDVSQIDLRGAVANKYRLPSWHAARRLDASATMGR